MTPAQIFYETPASWLYVVEHDPRPNVNDILYAVADFFKVRPTAILGKCREREIKDARHVFRWMLHTQSKMTSKETAKQTGSDHSTVLHSCATVDDYINTDPDFKIRVTMLRKRIYGNKAIKTKKKVA